ncbi:MULTISPECIES: hypothetical protein [unclassified Nocardioides]|uniref:hypothetical protein n=1 Tax=unclassified Nocardioides TaxID=2615069 RepID=UPI00070336EA|nr:MULTISPECIES: hypothetical protein [unclassified Nocardioides]KRC53934.1 hypothetical protein ASE19_07590 [Nocardioides sp. Root79]KRC71270.1 hypothetical protein ASE20_10005 [Nocardioides sp. Root240]
MKKIKIAGQEIEDGVLTLEQWDAWRKIPGIQPGHRQGSPVPDVLSDAPEFAELHRVRQRLIESEQQNGEAAASMDARNRERIAQHRRDLAAATLQGLEAPPRPELEEWQGLEHAVDFFTGYHVILEAVERHLLRERADDWRDHIRRKARKTHVKRAQAQQALAEAEELMVPFDAARREVDAAVERAARRGRGSSAEPAFGESVEEPAAAVDPNPIPANVPGEPVGASDRVVRDRRRDESDSLEALPSELQDVTEGLLQQRIDDNPRRRPRLGAR